ncbi:MAG: hypothetical protein ACI8P9_004329 [Parasphingorhabdus sp.]|jgi:hypothetical protein
MQSIINLRDYPIHRAESAAYQDMIDSARDTLNKQDALELPNFLLPDTLRELLEFAAANKTESHFMQGMFPAYSDNMNDRDDTELPDDHPSRIRLPASHHFIAGDLIDHNSPVRLLYNNKSFIEFLKSILGTPTLYTVADKLGCMSLLFYKPGDSNGWHFDTTEFIVSLVLQTAEVGGEYHYIPNLRSATDENLTEVSKRMQNPDNPVGIQKANLQSGSLFLFKGKNTLHRVTKIAGQQDRIVGILSYNQKPGHVLTESSRMAMYGRIN